MISQFPLMMAGATGGGIPLWMIGPFVLLLLLIATMPLAPHGLKHFWEKRYPWIAAGLGLAVVVYYLLRVEHGGAVVGHSLHEYISFIALVGSLFVVSGGIHIGIHRPATPMDNVVFLVFGAVLANIIGTTGASMTMIRPWLRMNAYRVSGHHVVFFIFIVSNVGGSLTPIGDPPLYLGFLRGVPFFWLIEQVFWPWLFTLGAILGVFYWLDGRNYRAARTQPCPHVAPVPTDREIERGRVDGASNLIFLGIILGAVLISLVMPPFYEEWFVREIIMVVAAAVSHRRTPARIHKANAFTFGPVKEVGFLFLGIFTTMIPALDYLEQHGKEVGLTEPWQYYVATGSLSAVLDNAPTYVNFLKLAQVSVVEADFVHDTNGVMRPEKEMTRWLLEEAPGYIVAISLGAVFFGAMTYIGNGPNFMVKSIAESAGVKTPTFFGYIFRYSLPFLLPILLLTSWLFL